MKVQIIRKEFLLLWGVSALVSLVVGAIQGPNLYLCALVFLFTFTILGSLFKVCRALYFETKDLVAHSNDDLRQSFVSLTSEIQAYRQAQTRDYRQTEDFLSLLFTIKPDLPLPDTRGWAASPDFLKKVVELIFIDRPQLIVETGSGVSTIIMAYCLRQMGEGRVISLEHDAKYYASSKGAISLHGLDNVATIIHAPLTEISLNGENWRWYSTDQLRLDCSIDMLIIDGPPGSVQRLSRYPALPVLYRHLNDSCKIILDDGSREDEKTVVSLWESQYPHITSTFLDLEKGAFLLEKNKDR